MTTNLEEKGINIFFVPYFGGHGVQLLYVNNVYKKRSEIRFSPE